VRLNLARLAAADFDVRWFDPRTGAFRPGGRGMASGPERVHVYTPPTSGPGQDWVLIVEAR
jgi:hypothetical protein